VTNETLWMAGPSMAQVSLPRCLAIGAFYAAGVGIGFLCAHDTTFSPTCLLRSVISLALSAFFLA